MHLFHQHFPPSLTHSLASSLPLSFPPSLPPSLTHSLTHSLPHSLTLFLPSSLPSSLLILLPFSSGCTHGKICLVSGKTKNTGRLQICYNGRWGSVCDDLFGDVDASVACRQLGYETGGCMYNKYVYVEEECDNIM